MYDSSYTIWDCWRALSLSYRFFVLVLTAVTIHSLISTALVMKGLRAIRDSDNGSPSLQSSVARLQARCANLRQILVAAAYFFGFLFFVGLQGAYNTLGLSKNPPFWEILENFKLHFVFAANVFLVFLALHVVQWVISRRIEARIQH